MRRDAGEEIDFGREEVDVQHRLQELPDYFQILGDHQSKTETGQRADDADAGARQHENAQDHAPRGAHRSENSDVAALVLHHHDHAGDDVERGDDDDQGQDQKHDVALDLDDADDAGIGALP